MNFYKIIKQIRINTLKENSNIFDSIKLDKHVYEWFIFQRSKNIPIAGTILQEIVREISNSLDDHFDAFKASNGWLEKFRKRHNISYRVISDESSSANVLTVNDWVQRIPIITEHYNAKNKFNCDETELFYKAIYV